MQGHPSGLDDPEWPKRTLAEKNSQIVLRSPPEIFECRETNTISGKMLGDDSSF